MTLLARSSLRYLRQHRAQVVLSVLGIALGVAVVVAIDLATQSARAGFRISAETVSGRATHHVTSATGSLDEALFGRLRTELGVRETAPVVEGFVSSAVVPGRALRILGVDPFSEAPFRPYVTSSPGGLDVSGLITTVGAAVLSASTAQDAQLELGDSLPVLVHGRSWALPILGILSPEDRLARAGLADVVLVDIASAQELLGLEGRLSRIDVRLPDGEPGLLLAERIHAVLPGGVRLEETGTRAEAMSAMIAAFDLNLTALSLLALIFGMFLIYNAMTFSVVQRRALLGRLRALGVTRVEILRVVLAEALWIGVAGSALGLALGAFLGRGLVRLVTRTINDLYFAVSVEGVTLEPLVFVKGAVLGVAATLIAALAPALEAASAPPRLALLRSSSEQRARRGVARAARAGVMLGLAGAAALSIPSGSVLLGFVALFLVMLGLALLTPAGTVLLIGFSAPILKRTGGMLGTMAARGVVTALSRTAPAIAALVVAVSVTVGLGVMIQSFRSTLVVWLDGTLQADVYVSLPGPQASRASGTLWPELVDAYVAHPGVAGHSTYRALEFEHPDGAFTMVALDLDPRGEPAFDFLAEAPGGAIPAFRSGEGLIVSEPYAYRRGLSVGDEVELPTPSGRFAVRVAGVFYDYGSDQGTVMLDRRLYDRLFDDPGITSLGLFLADGADGAAVIADLLSLVPADRTVVVRTNRALRLASLEVFDRTFRVTAVLRMLAFIVAFVGVLSALMALELERAREFGVLRASGLTPGQVWKLVATQTGLLGLVAGILAVPVGIVLSVVMIFVINKRSFGWTLHMELGPSVMLQAMALALAGALLAGLYPAWRMSRTSPALALRAE